ncbi:MAG: hypothetical protein M3Z28_09650 [Candidatus Dormibacteraeota bacterium]|nr:hypothetical protein [Candidatus Dormibacteraeota bacterium]
MDRLLVGGVGAFLAATLARVWLTDNVFLLFAIGIIGAFVAAYGWAFIRAPYEQRDALRSTVTAQREQEAISCQREHRLITDRALTNEEFFVWELLDDPSNKKPVVSNKILTDCVIKGPAMVTLIGKGELAGNKLGEGDLESVLHEMPNPGNKQGIIAFVNCKIIGCHFRAVGFYGPKELLDKIREGTTVV